MEGYIPRLFVLLGLSPGVLHTVLCAWRPRLRPDAEVVIVATSEETARRAIEIASRCPCPGGGGPPAGTHRFTVATLPASDVDSPRAIHELREALDKHGIGPRDAIDVTGGRKLASIAAALYAASKLALVGYTWIPTEEYRRITRSGADDCEATTRTTPRLIAPII